LSLHRWFLFFAPTAEASGGASGERPAPPYGFISLRRTALRVADAQGRRLVLASRGESQPLPPVGNAVNCDDWLEMCLLLADGRFQPMEAPRLQLRFEEAAAYEAWAAIIGEACADNMPTRPPALGPRIGAQAKPPGGGAGDCGGGGDVQTSL